MKLFKTPSSLIKSIALVSACALVVVGLWLPNGARAATPNFVQVKDKKISSGTENAVTFTKANGAGDLIVVHVLWGNAGNVTLTDTKNNTYTAVGPATRFNNNQWSSQIFYAKNIAAAPVNGNTVKATFATPINNWAMVYAHEYSGMDKISPVDTFATTTGTGTALSGSVTTHQANSLIFGAAIASDGSINSAGPGLEVRSKLSQDWTMDKVLPAVGTTSVTATRSTNGLWVLQTVAFKADSGDTVPPSVPLNLAATGVSTSQVNLSWDASTDNVGVTGYKIFRNGVQIATPTGTSYSDNGLSPGTSYTYTVSAYDAAGNNSAQSPSVVGSTLADTTAPSVPLNLVGSVISDTQINLSWNASNDNVGVTGYKVFRDGNEIVTTTGTSHQDTNLVGSTTYSYTVQAFDAAGNVSSPTLPVSATTQAPPDVTPPSVPTNLAATVVSPTQIDLSWDASTDSPGGTVTGVAGYKITRNGTEIANNVTATTYQDSSLTPGTAYTYTVSAFDGAGNTSSQSTPASATTPTPPDNTPPQVSLTQPIDGAVVRGTISVSATATDNVVVNRVEFSVDGLLVNTDTMLFYGFSLDTTTLSNDNHLITATAFDAAGNSASSSVTITVDNQAPTVPGNLAAQVISHTQIDLSWDPSSDNRGVDHYKVFRNSTEIVTLTGTTYQNTGLSPQTTYDYAVKAYDAVGNESLAATVSATTPAAPDTTPALLSNGLPNTTLPAGTSVATLSLDTNEAATCKYATVAGTAYSAMPNSFTTTGNTNHSTSVSGLADGQSYSYFVRCQDGVGNTNTTDFTISFSVANPTPPPGDVAFPLRASANNRYLEDQNGVPFLMMGDSPQGIIASLSLSDVDIYLDDRVNQYGFNTLWINLLSREQTGGPHMANTPDGIRPFNGFLPGHDGNPEYYDLATVNQPYFDRAKAIIDKALAQDMLVILDPIETMDFLSVLQNNADPEKARAYGRYLGEQFTQPNIIWMHGNDFNTYMNTTDRNLVRMVGEGIRETDNPNAMQTVLGFASPSEALDLVFNPPDPAWAPFINISTVYTYGPAYDYVTPEYQRATSYSDPNYQRGPIPVYLAESFYDFEDFVGRSNRAIKEFRWQQYWAMTGGAAGHTYGNYHSVFLDGNWQSRLDTPAAANISRMKQFFNAFPWYTLAPDQSIITSGAEGGDWNRATASITANGSLAMVYIPNARNITINMARMNGTVTARWFDPVTGTYQAIGSFSNTGTQQFTPPATGHTETNWYGGTETSSDWMLVLETTPTAPDTQPPTAATNLRFQNVGTTQLTLLWDPATDNIGVAGYDVYRSTTPDFTPEVANRVAQLGNVTTYNDASLSPATTYYYKVIAKDAVPNVGPASLEATVTTGSPPPPDTTPPSTPNNLVTNVISTSQINLSWDASTDTGGSGMRGYRVFYSTDGVAFTLIGSPANNNFSSTGLAAGTQYYYKVQADDVAGNVSGDSVVVSATTQSPPPPDTTPPTAPSNLVAGTITQTQVPLSWDASTDTPPGVVAGYHVFRCQGAGCSNFTQITQNLVTVTNYTDTNLSPSTTYVYKVRAFDSSNNSSLQDSNLLSVTTQTPPPVSAFLMAAWNFDEGTGTSTADRSGNGNTATLAGGATWAAGKYGSGVSLNGAGSGNHLAIANSPTVNISGNAMTVSLWLNPLSPFSSDTVVLGKFWNTTWSDPYYQYGVELGGGNQPNFQIGTTTGPKSASMGSSIPYGQWNHLAITFDGTQVQFYLNGNPVGTPKALVGSITAKNNPMNIGADQANAQNFRGSMDDVRIYNKVLTQAEVQADMNPQL